MDNLLCQHITNEVTELVMAENKRLQQENEDLKTSNMELLKDVKMCQILSARVNTLEKEYTKYYDRCVSLERVNDMLSNSLGISHYSNDQSDDNTNTPSPPPQSEPQHRCYNVVNPNNLTSMGVPLPQGMNLPY
jgi:hypothetical protein